ncbi:MAG: starch-binding protein [Lachnospiraceae bacterium]|nr:starch-binding protein [Lachnospiraceae bacterium]
MKKRIKSLVAAMTVSMLVTSPFSNWNFKAYAIEESGTKSYVENLIENEDVTKGMIDTKTYDYLALNKAMEKEEPKNLEESIVVSDFMKCLNSSDAVSEDVQGEYPASIDLSTSEYFPSVGNQGTTGSCWYYGNIYASLTFALNKDRGIPTTKSNTLNPIFGFNYAQKTSVTQHTMVKQLGYVQAGVLPIDTTNTANLFPIKEVWENALHNRALGLVEIKVFGTEDSVVTGPKDTSLNAIKKTLNDGGLAACSTLAYNWNKTVVASGEHKGEIAVDRCDLNKLGGHIVAIVGYDDNIWIDINYDGKVQTAEMGAFKIVNSWGDKWANNGFIWIAYDALNAKSQVLTTAEETRINNDIDAGKISANKVNNSIRKSFFMLSTFNRADVKGKKSSECLCYMTVNTGSRKEMTMTVTATDKEDNKEYSYTFPKLDKETDNLAWDGTVYSTDGTMVFDLDNVVYDISNSTMDNYNWQVTFEDDTLDEYSLTVKDLYFTVDGVKKYTTGVSMIPLNGSKRVYKMNIKTSENKEDVTISEENKKNIVIYYDNSEFGDTNIHYQLESGSWTESPGVQMSINSDENEYKWKYVINLGNESTVKLCFNDRNGTWDNNNKNNYIIEEAGMYGIKDGVITKYINAKDLGFEIDENSVYFEKPSDWKESVYAYVWLDGGSKEPLGAWPGTKIENIQDNIYGFVLDEYENNLMIIFNDGKSSNKTGKFKLYENTYYGKDSIAHIIVDSEEILTGWQEIEDKKYYYDEGVMQTSKWIDNKYYVKVDGTMAVSELVDGGRYYVDETGVWVSSSKWLQIGERWYYLKSGVVQKSKWLKVGTKYYYFDVNGVMQSSKWINNKYYVKSNGVMATSELVDGGRYYVDENGVWVTSTKWIKINNNWYYIKSGVVQKSKWLKVGTKWYYFNVSGVMQSSKWISGKYYVKADGSMAVSEWVDGGRYYVGSDGVWVPNP